MFNSAKNLKCRKLNYEFGKTIEVDIKKITTSKDILVKADITTNYYQIPKELQQNAYKKQDAYKRRIHKMR